MLETRDQGGDSPPARLGRGGGGWHRPGFRRGSGQGPAPCTSGPVHPVPWRPGCRLGREPPSFPMALACSPPGLRQPGCGPQLCIPQQDPPKVLGVCAGLPAPPWLGSGVAMSQRRARRYLANHISTPERQNLPQEPLVSAGEGFTRTAAALGSPGGLGPEDSLPHGPGRLSCAVATGAAVGGRWPAGRPRGSLRPLPVSSLSASPLRVEMGC